MYATQNRPGMDKGDDKYKCTRKAIVHMVPLTLNKKRLHSIGVAGVCIRGADNSNI
jgi:hypothetical protein